MESLERPFSPLRLAITSGEPAGIGPDLIAQLAHQGTLDHHIVIGDLHLLNDRAERAGLTVAFNAWEVGQATHPNRINVLHVPCPHAVIAGKLDSNNAPYVLSTLEHAHQLAMSGAVQGLVTAPISKAVINQSGLAFTGHTEFFQALAQVEQVVMMLMSESLKVALVTTHLPLAKVSNGMNGALIERVTAILNQALMQYFKLPTPRIGVLGLNPHAGEDGYLGREEIEVIAPALNVCLTKGINVSQPLSADTAFTPESLQRFDAILAMYHDQGLIPIKQTGFGRIANVTLGLPYVRTSVDHGTALDLAGTQQASASSFNFAIKTALAMVNNAT